MGRRYDDFDDDDDDFDSDDIDLRSRRRRDVGESKRLAAGLCAILVGSFGVHKFILGYGGEGAILLSLTLVGFIVGGVGGACCFFPAVLFILPVATSIIALIEGIIYLTKTDDEFVETYQIGHKAWF